MLRNIKFPEMDSSGKLSGVEEIWWGNWMFCGNRVPIRGRI